LEAVEVVAEVVAEVEVVEVSNIHKDPQTQFLVSFS
jgi:hypothetical protein